MRVLDIRRIRKAAAVAAFAAAALIAARATATAQKAAEPPPKLTPMQLEAAEKKRLQQEADREYRAAIKRMDSTGQAANDPWASVRGFEAKSGDRSGKK